MFKGHLSGKILKDAQLRYVGNDPVVNFTVYFTEVRTSASGHAEEKTTWVSCSYWGGTRDLASVLTQGTSVVLDGFPSSKIITKVGGDKVSILCLKVSLIHFPGTDNELLTKIRRGAPAGSSY